jgi:hypothetical protein
MTRWICGAATRRSALSSETIGGEFFWLFLLKRNRSQWLKTGILLFSKIRYRALQRNAPVDGGLGHARHFLGFAEGQNFFGL